MKLAIAGLGVWTAAGRGPEALRAALEAGLPCASAAPPYPLGGVAVQRCALAAGLERGWPARDLLAEVVSDALGDAPRARCGLVVGTSSGDLCGPWERWHRAVLAGEASGEEPGRDGTAAEVAARLGLDGPVLTLSSACISGTAAFAVAAAWLREGRCARVIVAGVDALSVFVHAGFAGLGALSTTGAQPFSEARDGLLLGEGAGALLVEPAEAAAARGARVWAWLRGVGLAADAVHHTAPDREGRGAASAMRAALAHADLTADQVDNLSLHGTGTRFNDAMEAAAVAALFGERPLAMHAIKGVIGHTLGAAGAIEAVVLAHAIGAGWAPPVPPSLGVDCPLRLAPPTPPTCALSTSSAFGGANAALVLAATPGDLGEGGPAELGGRVEVGWAAGEDGRAAWPEAPERWLRLDAYGRVGALAVERLLDEVGATEDTGVLLATYTGCRLADLRYHERLVARGPARASRLDFAATVLGVPAAEASIRRGLRGPALAILGSFEEAVDLARALVETGVARRLVAVWVEAGEPGGGARARARLVRRAGG